MSSEKGGKVIIIKNQMQHIFFFGGIWQIFPVLSICNLPFSYDCLSDPLQTAKGQEV